jgi:hypothetical protein
MAGNGLVYKGLCSAGQIPAKVKFRQSAFDGQSTPSPTFPNNTIAGLASTSDEIGTAIEVSNRVNPGKAFALLAK